MKKLLIFSIIILIINGCSSGGDAPAVNDPVEPDLQWNSSEWNNSKWGK